MAVYLKIGAQDVLDEAKKYLKKPENINLIKKL